VPPAPRERLHDPEQAGAVKLELSLDPTGAAFPPVVLADRWR
jgi:hypothetical protein